MPPLAVMAVMAYFLLPRRRPRTVALAVLAAAALAVVAVDALRLIPGLVAR